MAANESLAEVVLLHRRAAGLSRRDLSLLSGVSQTVLYDIEHGKETIRFATLQKVLKSLNIRILYDSPFLRELNDA